MYRMRKAPWFQTTGHKLWQMSLDGHTYPITQSRQGTSQTGRQRARQGDIDPSSHIPLSSSLPPYPLPSHSPTPPLPHSFTEALPLPTWNTTALSSILGCLTQHLQSLAGLAVGQGTTKQAASFVSNPRACGVAWSVRVDAGMCLRPGFNKLIIWCLFMQMWPSTYTPCNDERCSHVLKQQIQP